METTWVQRHISPIATRAFAKVGCIDRRHLAAGIRKVAARLDPDTAFQLWIALAAPLPVNKLRDDVRRIVQPKVVQPKFASVPLTDLDPSHVSKVMTTKKLLKAADRFFQETGRTDLRDMILPILEGRTESFTPQDQMPVNYETVLATKMPQVISGLPATDVVDVAWHSQVIQKAFAFASLHSRLPEEELVYRIEKMAGLGGNLQSILASLFVHIPALELRQLFTRFQTDEKHRPLAVYFDSVCAIVGRTQYLLENYNFDPAQLAADENYLEKKMSELIRGARTGEALLVFFLKKLLAARKCLDPADKIFDEVRFVYAPLAERIGLLFLADDLRDQHLRTSQPDVYCRIVESVRARFSLGYEAAKIFLSLYARSILSLLASKGINTNGLVVKFRVKSPFSIFNKVFIRKEYKFEDLKDIFGVKIICTSNSVAEVKQIAMLLSKGEIFRPTPGKTKVALDGVGDDKWRGIKIEGQSTAGAPLVDVEIQIMTADMNQANNHGKVASWWYNLTKELGGIRQVFTRREPPEVVCADYFSDFYQLLNFWTLRAETR